MLLLWKGTLLFRCYITYAMDFRFVPRDPVCLASCHILISKQDSTIRALRSNRCVTGRKSRDENHAMRFRQSAENCSRARDTQPTRGVSDELARGASVDTPWLLEEDMGRRRSPFFEYMSLHPSLTHHRNINLFENKVWEIYIFIKKCVRSFIEVRKLCLIMFPLCICMWLYNTESLSWSYVFF